MEHIEWLYKEYYRPLAIYAKQFVLVQEIAEDIVQDLFLNLYEKENSLHIKTISKHYLYKSVHNRCINKLKSEKLHEKKNPYAQKALIANLPDPQKIMERIEFENKFLKILESLPPKRRRVFEMSRVEGKSNDEIAKEMNVTKRAIENHIVRGLRIMRKQFADFLKSNN